MDYARWVFAYRLRGDSPEDFRRRGDKVDVNLGLFRRHIPRRGAKVPLRWLQRMQWLLQRVEEFLPELEERLGAA